MGKIYDEKSIADLVIYQLKSYWPEIAETAIRGSVYEGLGMMEENFRQIPSLRFSNNGSAVFNPLMSIHWMIFLYRLSNILYKSGGGGTAAQLYYLNKIMHSIDWFYEIELPIHFLCEHPLGSVLGRARYGDYLLVYQGTTVGGSVKDGVLYYPRIGDHVILFSNANVLGKTVIGDNVMISSGTQIINEEIPSNCIVFGKSPNLTIKNRGEEIISMIDEYWR